MDILVAEVIPQREQVQVEEQLGGERFFQSGGKIDTALSEKLLFQIRILGQVIKELSGNRWIVVEDESDGEFEL